MAQGRNGPTGYKRARPHLLPEELASLPSFVESARVRPDAFWRIVNAVGHAKHILWVFLLLPGCRLFGIGIPCEEEIDCPLSIPYCVEGTCSQADNGLGPTDADAGTVDGGVIESDAGSRVIPLTDAPPRRLGHAMTYDASRGKVLGFARSRRSFHQKI